MREKLRIYFRDKYDKWGQLRFGFTFVWGPGLLLILLGLGLDWLTGYPPSVEPEYLTPGDWLILVGFSLFIVGMLWGLYRRLFPPKKKNHDR